MAETASLVLIHGKMLIKEQQFSQCANFSFSIKRGLAHLAEGMGLNVIQIGNNPGDVLVEPRRHLSCQIW